MKIGFIGSGNMAQAMISGILQAKLASPDQVIASDAYRPCLDGAQEKYGIHITMDNKEVAGQAEVVVLAVKPQFYEAVIKEIGEVVKQETIIVTIAPGQTLEKLEGLFQKEVKIVRTMPNTPAMVGEGMTALCANGFVDDGEKAKVKELISGFGKAVYVPEYMMDAVVAVSGSAPAYVYLFIEALADGAVLLGMSRKEAYTFAAQTVMGSAKNGTGNRTASWGFKRYGLFSWRDHHRSGKNFGRGRIQKRCHQSDGSLCREVSENVGYRHREVIEEEAI